LMSHRTYFATDAGVQDGLPSVNSAFGGLALGLSLTGRF
jgi:hypothetical protein